MSWQSSGWAKKVKVSISGEKITKAEKHLLLTMADDYVEHLGYAEVSVRELADNSESSERQARYCLRRLEAKRFIETHLGGPGRLSRYRFLGYWDGAKSAPGGKKEDGAKIAPPMGQRLPGANSSMGQLSVGDGAISSLSPPQTPPLSLKTLKTNKDMWSSAEALIKLFNEKTPEEIPAVMKLSPGRRQKANQNLKAFPERDFWVKVCEEYHKSSFLRGTSGRKPGHENFEANFDWLLSKGKDGTENCVKVWEGRYRHGAAA